MNWIKESNRPKHLLYAIPAGALLTILFVAGLAAGSPLHFLELKEGFILLFISQPLPFVFCNPDVSRIIIS